MTFLATLQAARKDFFKLKKQRDEPAWALWLLTLLVSLAWGAGFLLLGWLLGGRDFGRQGWSIAPPFFVTSLVVGLVVHLIYSAIERWAPQGFIDWTNGEPTAAVSAFFAATSIAGVLLGLFIARELLGGVPGTQRIDWTAQRGWTSFAGVAVLASLIWGLWAWQEWSERTLRLQAKEAELKLLQAQIEPHFLFNTLANVRALVDAGSPQASQVLGSLIAYLRAAVPRLQDDRATLGAAQNRLEATINNISTQFNNLSAANSRIRDVDVAEETAALARHRILMQSGVSVLAQANQLPQLALQLLQG